MGIKSAYRQLKETVRGPDKQFHLDVLKEQLDRHWVEVTKEGLTADIQLHNRQQQAQAQIDARDPKAAARLIQELAALIPDVKAARALAALEQERKDRHAQRTQVNDRLREQQPNRADDQDRASDAQLAAERQGQGVAQLQADVLIDPNAAWSNALADVALREAATLAPNQEAAANRPADAAPAREAVVTLRNKGPRVMLAGSEFASEVTVDGTVFEKPEFLGKGSFGTAARYSTADGKTIVMKAVQAGDAGLEHELAINRKLSQGPADAPGRENVLLMNGFVKGKDGTSYILMDEASGDLNMVKYGMNALNETGGLPEEVRNVINQQMMKQALQGAKYMHDQGVDHFDLKEGNMLIMPDGTVKIIDFGGSVADGQDGDRIDPTRTPAYSPEKEDGIMYGLVPLKHNKWDAFSLGTMLESLHHGENPLGRGKEMTGVLGRVHDSMTVEAAAQRTTLEAALESEYFRDLDSHEPETIKELMAATVAYSSALRGREIDGEKAEYLNKNLHEERLYLREHEAKMKEATNRGEAPDVEGWRAKQASVKTWEAKLRLLANDESLQPYRDKVLEISQRLQRGA